MAIDISIGKKVFIKSDVVVELGILFRYIFCYISYCVRTMRVLTDTRLENVINVSSLDYSIINDCL